MTSFENIKTYIVNNYKVTEFDIKMVLPEEYDLEEQLCILNENIKEKYQGKIIF